MRTFAVLILLLSPLSIPSEAKAACGALRGVARAVVTPIRAVRRVKARRHLHRVKAVKRTPRACTARGCR